MLARILSSVLFPDPLRPTMPKNSPRRTSKEMPCRAWRSQYSWRSNGWTALSLKLVFRFLGIRNDLWMSTASMATGACARASDAAPGAAALASSMMLVLCTRDRGPEPMAAGLFVPIGGYRRGMPKRGRSGPAAPATQPLLREGVRAAGGKAGVEP